MTAASKTVADQVVLEEDSLLDVALLIEDLEAGDSRQELSVRTDRAVIATVALTSGQLRDLSTRLAYRADLLDQHGKGGARRG